MHSATPRIVAAALVALLAAALGVGPARAQVGVSNLNCTTPPTGHIVWPTANPVWVFDFVRPSARTTTRGAGLEIRDAFFNGHRVLTRGNAPVLNVEYNPGGGCSCFRDWSYEEAVVQTGLVAPGGNSCVAIASLSGSVRTTCESNQGGGTGGDVGTFLGVAIEDFGTELVLTGNMQAGWYRYRIKWHFYLDGRIWPEYSYSAASATCTSATHRHHAYWRFDFDIDGTPSNDTVTEINPSTSTSTTFTTEASRTWGAAASGIYWAIRDGATSAGYDIVPSSVDRLLPVDSFSKLDFMVLQYHAGVYDDGVNSLGDCAIHSERMVGTTAAPNVAEAITGLDTEVWYRSSALHTGGNPWECDIVGPTLRPVGFTPTSGEPGQETPPEGGILIESARPNPFNPTTAIRFRLAEAQYVTVRLYDVTGRQVATLFEGWARENREEIVRIDGTTLPGGTYVVRVEGASVQGSTRVVLMR